MEPTKYLFLRKKLLHSISQEQATAKSIRQLVENIQLISGQEIGYNTLRRFFGLLKPTSPSDKTIELIQAYLDKVSTKYIRSEADFVNAWKPVSEMYLLIQKQDFSKLIEFLISQREIPIFPQLLGTLTCQLIASKNIAWLEVIYKTDEIFEDRAAFSDYLSEIVCGLLKMMPIDELKQFESVFLMHHFKESIFYFYIDYSALNSYYGYFLSRFEAENPQEEIFLNCIIGYKSYLSGGQLSFIPKYSFEELKDFFPTLVGRYIGYQMMYYPLEVPKIIQQLVEPAAREFEPHYLFIEIFPALILIKDFRSIAFLIDKYYEPLYEVVHWYSYNAYNIYLITETLLYINEGDMARARVVYPSINLSLSPSSYYDYTNLLYLILSYQITDSESEKTALLQKYFEITERTGLSRFDRNLIENYFNW